MSKKYNLLSEEGFIPVIALVTVVTVIGLVSSANISITKEIPTKIVSQSVLGEDEEIKKAEEELKEAMKMAEEVQKEADKAQREVEKKQEEIEKEIIKSKKLESKDLKKIKKESILPTGERSKLEVEGEKSETEVETADGRKVKTKIEDDGRMKIEIKDGDLKFKYVVKDGKVYLKAENEEGEEVDFDEEDLKEVEDEVENELEKEGIKIATGSGIAALSKNNIAALIDFPLSVDVSTNQLIVTTPAGQKVVTTLPDKAVSNLLATNIINKIDQTSNSSLTQDLGELDGVVKLEIRNNEMVYKIKGTKTHKLLGIVPIDMQTTAFVSAQTGQPVAQEQSVLANIVDIFSF